MQKVPSSVSENEGFVGAAKRRWSVVVGRSSIKFTADIAEHTQEPNGDVGLFRLGQSS